jgi:23S rRNA (cytidine2498-2'-O)-methyltransferase
MASRGKPDGPSAGDLYLGAPTVVDVLIDEIKSLRSTTPEEIAPGIVVVPPGKIVDPAFARQVMPDAKRLREANANSLAAGLLDGDVLPDSAEVVLPEMARRGSHALEEHPLAAAAAELDDVLKKKIEGRREKHGDAPSGLKLRVLLVDTWTAWRTMEKPLDVPPLLAWPSPFPGGRALGEEPKNAPSSAHRKLDEALAWLGAKPGEGDVVIDLGAAPGGWSWVALQNGAKVIAIDRADLDPNIAKHERLTHVRADAFKYVPDRWPQWLLCDVIAEPQRSFDLAKNAVTHDPVKALVITLKLKKPVQLDVVNRARAFVRTTPGFIGRVKNLVANKLEVTLMMKRL